MDTSMKCYIEAMNYLNSYVELSLADEFFEADNDTRHIVANNEKAKTGALASLKKMFLTLITSIQEAIKKFKDFIKEGFESDKVKANLRKLKVQVSKDPILASTPVSVKDFKEQDDLYNKALHELDKANKDPNSVEQTFIDILDKYKDDIKALTANGHKMAERGTMAVTLKAALEIADKNAISAKAINMALDQELITLESIQKTLGDRDAANFEKKIRKYAKNGFFHRLKVKTLYKKQNDLKSVLKQNLSSLLKFTNIDENGKIPKDKVVVDMGSLIKGAIANPSVTSKTLGGPKGTVKTAAGLGKMYLGKKKIMRDSKQARKDIDDARRFFGFSK